MTVLPDGGPKVSPGFPPNWALSEGCRTKTQKLFKALTKEGPCLRIYKTRRNAPFENIDPLLRS
jgi:hypothetical protein